MSPGNLQPLSVFDFDGTLIHGDSLWSFFALAAGWPQVALASAETVAAFTVQHFLHQDDRAVVDRKTFFKQQMLQRLIAGKRVEDFKQPIAALRDSLRWNETLRQTLQEHYDQGHHIVISSGALDLYLPELVKDLPHHALLCTTIEVDGGLATAVMPDGNCVRQGKAARVTNYIASHGPFGESWGFGNFPDDVPMLNLVRHRIIV